MKKIKIKPVKITYTTKDRKEHTDIIDEAFIPAKWVMDVMKVNAKGKRNWLVNFFGKLLERKYRK